MTVTQKTNAYFFQNICTPISSFNIFSFQYLPTDSLTLTSIYYTETPLFSVPNSTCHTEKALFSISNSTTTKRLSAFPNSTTKKPLFSIPNSTSNTAMSSSSCCVCDATHDYNINCEEQHSFHFCLDCWTTYVRTELTQPTFPTRCRCPYCRRPILENDIVKTLIEQTEAQEAETALQEDMEQATSIGSMLEGYEEYYGSSTANLPTDINISIQIERLSHGEQQGIGTSRVRTFLSPAERARYRARREQSWRAGQMMHERVMATHEAYMETRRAYEEENPPFNNPNLESMVEGY